MKIKANLRKLIEEKYLITLFTILALKTGLSPIGRTYVGWLQSEAKAFPEPVNFLHSSLLPVFLMRLLNYPNFFFWIVFSLIVYESWILITIHLITNKFQEKSQLVGAIFICTSQVSCSLTMIGHVDQWSLLGATLIVFWDSKYSILIGTILCLGGNADQAIAISLCLVVFSFSGSSKAKNICKTFVPISVTGYLLLRFLVHKGPSNSIRELLLANVKPILLNSIGLWHLELFSLMSLSWIPWLYFVWKNLETRKKKISVSLSVVVIPYILIFFVLDGTRVGTTVGMLTLALSYTEFGKFQTMDNIFFLKNRCFILWICAIVPTIIVGNGPLLRLPFLKYFQNF